MRYELSDYEWAKFNPPLRYDEKVDKESKAEASKFFDADLKK